MSEVDDLDQPILAFSVNEVNQLVQSMHDALAAFKTMKDDGRPWVSAPNRELVNGADDSLHDAFHMLVSSVDRQKREAVHAAHQKMEEVEEFLRNHPYHRPND